jgi:hypothetical protein
VRSERSKVGSISAAPILICSCFTYKCNIRVKISGAKHSSLFEHRINDLIKRFIAMT